MYLGAVQGREMMFNPHCFFSFKIYVLLGNKIQRVLNGTGKKQETLGCSQQQNSELIPSKCITAMYTQFSHRRLWEGNQSLETETKKYIFLKAKITSHSTRFEIDPTLQWPFCRGSHYPFLKNFKVTHRPIKVGGLD